MSAKSDDHGHAWNPPGWLITFGIVVLFLVILNAIWGSVSDRINPNQRLYEQQTQINDLRDQLNNRSVGLTGGNTSRLANTAPRRQPTPQEIWDRSTHSRGRVCAPCDQTRGFSYEQDPVTCQCEGRRWVSGPMPSE